MSCTMHPPSPAGRTRACCDSTNVTPFTRYPYSSQIDSDHFRERQSLQDAHRAYVHDLDDQHDVSD